MKVYVGMDVHRKRTQVAVVADSGEELANRNVRNDPAQFLPLLASLPRGTPVAFEAAYGWGWLVELLEELGLEPHLAHPLGCKAIAAARLKDDRVDARTLAHLLRAGLLPEAWLAPPIVRDLRTLLRYRAFLIRWQTALKVRIHAILADQGYQEPPHLWSKTGTQYLTTLSLPVVPR